MVMRLKGWWERKNIPLLHLPHPLYLPPALPPPVVQPRLHVIYECINNNNSHAQPLHAVST